MPQVGVGSVTWDELFPGTTIVSQYSLITKKFGVYGKYEKRDKKFITWITEYINQDGELCQRYYEKG